MDNNFRFVNANASVGFDGVSYDFLSLNALLSHLDRLGIDSAVVWSKAAIPSVWEENKRLLADIQNTLGAKNRIFPSLVVIPTMISQKCVMQELKDTMEKHNIRAIRALPAHHAYDMLQLEPILEQIKELKPVVFTDMGIRNNVLSFLFLAEKFPEMPFIVTNGMWGDMTALFDLMRRRSNVFAETSWIHTEGTIKLLAKEFGSKRIIFGADLRSHNGASIAGLVHAEISNAEKSLVAGGNIIRILGLGAEKNKKTEKQKGNQLWKDFINGKRLDVPVIDAHTHTGIYSPMPVEETTSSAVIRKMLKYMDRIGIEKSITCLGIMDRGGTVEGDMNLRKMLKPHRDRFSGYLSFHPLFAKEFTEKLDDFFSDGFFIGFKTICDYWKTPVTDERFTPAWEYADKHRLPILFHTWTGGYDSPGQLKNIVKKYPNAQFILGHSGGSNEGRLEAEELAVKNNNVYLEWCGSFCSSILWEETIARVGKNKILFGSDALCHSIDWELGRLLSLNVPDGDLIPILGSNMEKILAMRH